MSKGICPLRSTNEYTVDCLKTECAWYDECEQDCAVLVLAKQAAKLPDSLSQLG